jgi:hypothetical protein
MLSSVFVGTLGLLAMAPQVLGKEMQPDAKVAAELYEDGTMMERIMQNKFVSLWLFPAVTLSPFQFVETGKGDLDPG